MIIFPMNFIKCVLKQGVAIGEMLFEKKMLNFCIYDQIKQTKC